MSRDDRLSAVSFAGLCVVCLVLGVLIGRAL
jgi:hypothetical protein